jgi:hypothetical protein
MRPLRKCQADPVDPVRGVTEQFAALLTQVAYDVALRHGVAGSFADLELDLWKRLRAVVAEHIPEMCRPVCLSSGG